VGMSAPGKEHRRAGAVFYEPPEPTAEQKGSLRYLGFPKRIRPAARFSSAWMRPLR